jgi:hypothetical protein
MTDTEQHPVAAPLAETRVKVPFEGDTVDAEEISFSVTSPTVQVLELADGEVIEFRHTVSKVYRLCDRKKEDGSPIYLVTGEAKLRRIGKKE